MYLATLPSSFGIDPWSSETVQQLPLGSIGYDPYGNMYRYVQQNASAAGIVGQLYTRPAVDTQFVDMAVPTAVAAGSKTIGVTLGSTATTAGLLDGARAVISITPGIGQQFTVKSHTVASGAALCTLTIEEAVVTALTTSSKVTVVPNGAKNVIVNPTTFTGNPMGVMITALPVSTFGWVGTHGVFGALADATTAAVSFGISPSVTTAGCITKAVTLKDSIGYVIVATVSAQVEPEWFNIN